MGETIASLSYPPPPGSDGPVVHHYFGISTTTFRHKAGVLCKFLWFMVSYKLLNCNYFTIVWCKKTKAWYIYFCFYCTPIFDRTFFEGLTINDSLANLVTAKMKLERLQKSTSSSFFKVWSACSCEFKAYFWTFWALYHLLFELKTIGVR